MPARGLETRRWPSTDLETRPSAGGQAGENAKDRRCRRQRHRHGERTNVQRTAEVRRHPRLGSVPARSGRRWSRVGPRAGRRHPRLGSTGGHPATAGPNPAAPPTAPGTAQPGWGPSPGAARDAQPGWGAPSAGTPNASGASGGTPPGGWSPQPVAPSGSSGCLKVIVILVVLGAILVALLVGGLALFANRIADSVGVNGDGTIGKACTFIDNAALSDALGSKAEALQLTGFYDATIGIILDKRVLPDAEDCWITADQATPTGRIAKHVGGDAASVFQQERQKAAPTSQDQGGGVSLTSSGYFGGNVAGLGDEAFCTGLSPTMQAGVLARKGNTLVYVSLSGPADGSQPNLGTTPGGVVTAPDICAAAQKVARPMLP